MFKKDLKNKGELRFPFLLSPTLEVIADKQSFVISWINSSGEKVQKVADSRELLAIKILTDEHSYATLWQEGLRPAQINSLLIEGAKTGFLIPENSELTRLSGNNMITTDAFTIQWHITNDCDLACSHCYDRTKRSPLTMAQGLKVLEDLVDFCNQKNVRGHVCFSGGNPFLFPHFEELYREAALRGFSTSILGNPVKQEKLQNIINIQKPNYYQVSLEGLETHNDLIRGEGYFQRVLHFLALLRELKVDSAVMLTLTRDNLDQVLLLANFLQDKADYFTYNRLSVVGEGSALAAVSPEEYRLFIYKYIEAAKNNRIIGFKDNLINIALEEQGAALFDGCTGFGCGAAFNFIAILPDGQVDACRKFPSPLGNINERSLQEIYDSPTAAKYRAGSAMCNSCRLKSNCGGCLSSVFSQQGNIFEGKDPYCWL